MLTKILLQESVSIDKILKMKKLSFSLILIAFNRSVCMPALTVRGITFRIKLGYTIPSVSIELSFQKTMTKKYEMINGNSFCDLQAHSDKLIEAIRIVEKCTGLELI